MGPLFCLRDLQFTTRIYLIPGETQSGSRHSTSYLDVTLAVETQSGFQVTQLQILTLHSASRTGEGGGGCPKKGRGEGGLCFQSTHSPLFNFQSPFQFKFQILKFQISKFVSRRPEPSGPQAEPSRLRRRERSWAQFLPLAVGVHKGKIMGSIPSYCRCKHSDSAVHPTFLWAGPINI